MEKTRNSANVDPRTRRLAFCALFTALGVVLAGRVHMEHLDVWGSKTLLGQAGPGDLFAETYACLPDEPLRVSVVAAENGEALFLETGQLLQCAFHLCRAVRAVNVDFPRFLHGSRRPFRYLFRITLFAGRHCPENKHVSIRSYVIILLFMPIVKRKKKIFSPKMRKSGTCFAQMPLLRNYYYYNTIFK